MNENNLDTDSIPTSPSLKEVINKNYSLRNPTDLLVEDIQDALILERLTDNRELDHDETLCYLLNKRFYAQKQSKICTYNIGYINQPVFSCLTCSRARMLSVLLQDTKIINISIKDIDLALQKTENYIYFVGVCFACSLQCHYNHDILSIGERRFFRCDCPTEKDVDIIEQLRLHEILHIYKNNEETDDDTTSINSSILRCKYSPSKCNDILNKQSLTKRHLLEPYGSCKSLYLNNISSNKYSKSAIELLYTINKALNISSSIVLDDNHIKNNNTIIEGYICIPHTIEQRRQYLHINRYDIPDIIWEGILQQLNPEQRMPYNDTCGDKYIPYISNSNNKKRRNKYTYLYIVGKPRCLLNNLSHTYRERCNKYNIYNSDIFLGYFCHCKGANNVVDGGDEYYDSAVDGNTDDDSTVDRNFDSINSAVDRNCDSINSAVDRNCDSINSAVDRNYGNINSAVDRNTTNDIDTNDVSEKNSNNGTEKDSDTQIMYICIVCENYFHSNCISYKIPNEVLPPTIPKQSMYRNQINVSSMYSLVCSNCSKLYKFLQDYKSWDIVSEIIECCDRHYTTLLNVKYNNDIENNKSLYITNSIDDITINNDTNTSISYRRSIFFQPYLLQDTKEKYTETFSIIFKKPLQFIDDYIIQYQIFCSRNTITQTILKDIIISSPKNITNNYLNNNNDKDTNSSSLQLTILNQPKNELYTIINTLKESYKLISSQNILYIDNKNINKKYQLETKGYYHLLRQCRTCTLKKDIPIYLCLYCSELCISHKGHSISSINDAINTIESCNCDCKYSVPEKINILQCNDNTICKKPIISAELVSPSTTTTTTTNEILLCFLWFYRICKCNQCISQYNKNNILKTLLLYDESSELIDKNCLWINLYNEITTIELISYTISQFIQTVLQDYDEYNNNNNNISSPMIFKRQRIETIDNTAIENDDNDDIIDTVEQGIDNTIQETQQKKDSDDIPQIIRDSASQSFALYLLRFRELCHQYPDHNINDLEDQARKYVQEYFNSNIP